MANQGRCGVEKGKANKALCEFLADHFGVAASRIRIVSGETSAVKRIHVDDQGRAATKGKRPAG